MAKLRSRGWALADELWRAQLVRAAEAELFPSLGWRAADAGWRAADEDPYSGVVPPNPQRQFPASLAAWAAAFPTLPTPLAIWTFQESASPIDDKVGSNDFVANGAATGLSYAQAGDLEPTDAPRNGLEFTATATTEFAQASADATFGNIPAGGTRFMLIRFRAPDNATNNRSVCGKGISTADRWGLSLVATSGVLRATVGTATNSQVVNSAAAKDDGSYHDVAYGVSSADDTVKLVVDASDDLSVALGAALNTELDALGIVPANALRVGACLSLSPVTGTRISYMALFDAVFTAAHMATFRTEQ